MKEIKVVIGKNFGDEGKGQTVSDLCRGQSALVVKHNGGAQAGHTVEEGRFRHVFHQLGSGSLWGAPTYLSHTFLPDLLKLEEEMEAVNKAFLYASPDCACTVIYDVILNSLTELLRGEERHGSCGMGIYEAVLRSREEEFRLSLKDFADAWELGKQGAVKEIAAKLVHIRREYALSKIEGLKEQFRERWDREEVRYWVSLVEDDNVLWNVAEEMCMNYKKYVIPAEFSDLIRRYDRIVFENAQGLMLDEENEEYYPHLTPSHTGLRNVVQLINEMSEIDLKEGVECPEESRDAAGYDLEIIYVTRTYVTRHGAGRLDYECTREEINPDMEDLTNIPNPWQNTLRFAHHPSGEEFFRPMLKDLKELEGLRMTGDRKGYSPMVTLRLNHLDETDHKILFADGDMEIPRFEAFCGEKGLRVWKRC